MTDSKTRYRAWLQSDSWKTKRLGAIKKQRGKCCICGHVSAYNDVHHVQYRDTWDDTKPSDLKVLCRRCHKAVHQAIAAMGKDYRQMDLGLKWKKTLQVIGKYSLIPEHYLGKKVKKRNKGTEKHSWKTKVAVNQLRDSKLTVVFTKEMAKAFLKYLNKRQAALLGLTFPLASGWKNHLIGKEFPRHVIKAVKEESSCDLESKQYIVQGMKPTIQWRKKNHWLKKKSRKA